MCMLVYGHANHYEFLETDRVCKLLTVSCLNALLRKLQCRRRGRGRGFS